ncbi:MAG TPA: hypothetical protein VF789_21635 [Thermoanaerobaculia bacterium]
MTILLPKFKAAASGSAQSRMSLLTDKAFVNLEIRELGRNAEGEVEVEYVITLENVTATTLPDNLGRELVLYLPAGVHVEPGASATLGSLNVVAGGEGQPSTVEWDVELAGAASESLKSTKSRRGLTRSDTKTTSSSSGTVIVKVTVPDLPIQGSALILE